MENTGIKKLTHIFSSVRGYKRELDPRRIWNILLSLLLVGIVGVAALGFLYQYRLASSEKSAAASRGDRTGLSEKEVSDVLKEYEMKEAAFRALLEKPPAAPRPESWTAGSAAPETPVPVKIMIDTTEIPAAPNSPE